MKKPQIISSVTTFFVGVTVAVSMLGGSVYAATGQIYLTPATASVQKGNSITLNLLINPGTTVDSAQATVNFDTAKLTFVSASTTTSAFSAQLQQTVSGGTITIARGDLGGGVSANASIIETITFTAAADTGTTDVTLTNANAVDANAHTYTAPSVANARLTLTAPPVTPTPPATCPTGQTGTPPTCVTPTTGTGNTTGSTGGGTTPKTTPKTTPTPTTTTPTPTPTDTTPTVTVPPVVEFTKANVTVATAVPTKVFAEYGMDKTMLDKQTDLSDLATSHNIVFDSNQLTPGMTYYYVVVATDAQGHITQSDIQDFTTKGLTVTVGVSDSLHKPLKNKKIMLHSTPMTATTDDRGFATFSDVSPGTHHVMYQVGSKTYDKEITVVNNVESTGDTQTAPVQNVAVIYGLTQDSGMLRVVIVTTLLLVLVVVVVLVLRRKARFVAPSGTPLTMQPVVVGGNPSVSAPIVQPTPEAQEMAQRLNSIPPPSSLSPGSTIAPIDEEKKEL